MTNSASGLALFLELCEQFRRSKPDHIKHAARAPAVKTPSIVVG